ncbi:MAG: MFS transporter [Promethearchaeota archaeon]|jgi:sugar phosphate permease
MVRYGLTDWLPLIIVTSGDFFNIWKSIFYPIGGVIGVILGAWISDKFMGKKRIPVVCAFFILLSLTLFIYTLLPPLDIIFGIPVLILIGILNFAPHALLVSTIPMEFSTRKAASAATGFIDGCGYIGAFYIRCSNRYRRFWSRIFTLDNSRACRWVSPFSRYEKSSRETRIPLILSF